jgi:3-hydroxyisobutyrate dehydrogenase-like beta-hydroxyacid dehydrogenase
VCVGLTLQMTSRPIVTVFGLGEAGSLIAADLAESGAEVHGYDPAPVPTPAGVVREDSPSASVGHSHLVLAVTAAVDAKRALQQTLDRLGPGTIYADLSTAPPSVKEELGTTAASRRLSFADVALMGRVPGNGLATLSLASGPGAARYVEIINSLGGNSEIAGERPGDAAARKLLRSVVTKGLTSLLIESLEAAAARDDAEWLWRHLLDLITDADETLVGRFITGTPTHIDRRIAEMESARAFLESLGVPSSMTSATVETLRRVQSEGMPQTLTPISDH